MHEKNLSKLVDELVDYEKRHADILTALATRRS